MLFILTYCLFKKLYYPRPLIQLLYLNWWSLVAYYSSLSYMCQWKRDFWSLSGTKCSWKQCLLFMSLSFFLRMQTFCWQILLHLFCISYIGCTLSFCGKNFSRLWWLVFLQASLPFWYNIAMEPVVLLWGSDM